MDRSKSPKEPRLFAHFKEITLPASDRYDIGHKDGRAEAEAEHAAKDAALVSEFNDHLGGYGVHVEAVEEIPAAAQDAIDEAYSNAETDGVLLTDTATGKAYRLFAIDGILIMEAASGTGSDDITLTDTVTGKAYRLFVNDGSLMMEEESGTGVDGITLTDTVTETKYRLLVNSGSLMMEEI